MTREVQKQIEQRYTKLFLDRYTKYTELKSDEKPDFRVCREGLPDIALELTEYHPAAEGCPAGISRVQVEARWWKSILPFIDAERRTRPWLENVRVRVRFKNAELPSKRAHKVIARELVEVVECARSAITSSRESLEVRFSPGAILNVTHNRRRDTLCLASEDWPLASTHLTTLHLSVWPSLGRMPWTCSNIMSAFVALDCDKMRNILEEKAGKAKGYNLAGTPLWLLIVCDLHGDVQSHVFPEDEADLEDCLAVVNRTGFDFPGSPFSEVWLLSAFTGNRQNLYCRCL